MIIDEGPQRHSSACQWWMHFGLSPVLWRRGSSFRCLHAEHYEMFRKHQEILRVQLRAEVEIRRFPHSLLID